MAKEKLKKSAAKAGVSAKTEKSVKKAVKTDKKAKPVAKTVKPSAKSNKPAAKTVKPAVKAKKKVAVESSAKPVKEVLNKTQLFQTIGEQAGLEPKQVKKVFGALESVITGSLNKKGAGTFVMPGLFKVSAIQVPSKKIPAIKKGTLVKNPFKGGIEEPHPGRPAGVKPATVKFKVRAMKKLKDSSVA